MIVLAGLAAHQAPPTLSQLLFIPLHFVIYVILGPFVYLSILLFGVELAIPGGTPLRALVRRHGAVSQVKIALTNEPYTRLLSGVAVLFAVAFWATVITAWLNKYFQGLQAPPLAHPNSASALIFVTTFVVGLVAGDLWMTGVRLAQTARTSLAVLAISMALSGTLLFFYIVEPTLRDILLVSALGIFIGELGVVARHPTLFHEGLWDVLRSPVEPDTEEIVEADDDTTELGDDDQPSPSGAWLSTQTRAIRERLAAQKLLSVGAHRSDHLAGGASGEQGQQRDSNPPRPV